MVKVAVGVKKGMTQIFQNTQVVPVTVVEISPNIIVDIRSKEKHGYSSIVLAYGRPVKKKFKRSFLGQLKTKKKLANLREFSIRIEQRPDIKQGDKISVENFKTGEKVAVQGISKGKGFQGVIKRYGFKRGPETHGSEHHRRVGSIGMCSFPGRVFKGKKMPGRTGGRKVSIKNLEIVRIEPEKNLIYLKGSIPGAKKGYVAIKGE